MKIDFKSQTLKGAPGISCGACDAPRELCEILCDVSDACFWHDFKNCSQSSVFNL